MSRRPCHAEGSSVAESEEDAQRGSVDDTPSSGSSPPIAENGFGIPTNRESIIENGWGITPIG
jgi:hypothetical protein